MRAPGSAGHGNTPAASSRRCWNEGLPSTELRHSLTPTQTNSTMADFFSLDDLPNNLQNALVGRYGNVQKIQEALETTMQKSRLEAVLRHYGVSHEPNALKVDVDLYRMEVVESRDLMEVDTPTEGLASHVWECIEKERLRALVEANHRADGANAETLQLNLDENKHLRINSQYA